MRRTTALRLLALVTLYTSLVAGRAAAHAGSLRVTDEPVSVPFWLFLLTGGGVVGASFLLASLVTDHDLIRAINGRRRTIPTTLLARLVPAARVAGLAALAAVLLGGLVGPQAPAANLAVLVVWVGWWAGYTMSVYLVGDTWPAIDPWRTLASWLPSLDRPLPDAGDWPAVAALLGLVWLEVVSPVADSPRLLAAVVVGYTGLTLAGAAVYGSSAWFGRVDPIARVFRSYGRVAPVRRTGAGVELSLPGTALVRDRGVVGVPFVIALVWVTTYDGLVSTPAWTVVARAVVGAGVPPLLVYLAALVAGYGLFLGVYRYAARFARRTAGTYVSARTIADRFAPSLLPIAAGYHLAHFLGFFLGLAPALAAVALDPFSPPGPVRLVPPAWFAAFSMAFVVLGHLVAIWVAHAVSFDLFAGRLQPIRGQYPLVLVMIAYTATGLWIVSSPSVAPPYV